MVWHESFSFWWFFPLVMIFLCLLMCVSRRRAGMPWCCGGWGGPRDRWRAPPADRRHEKGRSSDAEPPSEEGPGVEGLRSAVECLERRLRRLEEGPRQKKLDGG